MRPKEGDLAGPDKEQTYTVWNYGQMDERMHPLTELRRRIQNLVMSHISFECKQPTLKSVDLPAPHPL